MNKDLYYNPNKLLSFNRILNMVIGARGIGKTYGFKKHVIKRFLKHGEKFIFLRRYKSELKEIHKFFDAIKVEFPDHEFQVKGWRFYIDGNLCGQALPLSMWQSFKSTDFPDYCTIIFDEFIREKDKSGYMPNDVEALLNVMDTVFRNRDNVRCICLSNAVTVANPYFLYFNLVPNIKKRYNNYENIVVEIPDSVDFSEERRKTRFGRLIDNTNYGDMSLDNEFTNDHETFIEKRSKDSKFKFSLVYKGETFGVWVDVDNTIMYMSFDHDPHASNQYAIQMDDMTERSKLGKSRTNLYIDAFAKSFQRGVLRFDNQVVRTMGYEMLRKLNVQ